MSDTPCPPPTMAGREDRCGRFQFPPRCTESECAYAPTDPDPGFERRQTDRRRDPRRAEDQRLHLASELVIVQACKVTDSYSSPLGLDIPALEQLGALVEVLRSARRDVEALGGG